MSQISPPIFRVKSLVGIPLSERRAALDAEYKRLCDAQHEASAFKEWCRPQDRAQARDEFRLAYDRCASFKIFKYYASEEEIMDARRVPGGDHERRTAIWLHLANVRAVEQECFDACGPTNAQIESAAGIVRRYPHRKPKRVHHDKQK